MKRAHEVEESEPNKKIAEAPKPKAKRTFTSRIPPQDIVIIFSNTISMYSLIRIRQGSHSGAKQIWGGRLATKSLFIDLNALE